MLAWAMIAATCYCFHGLIDNAVRGDRDDGVAPIMLSIMLGLCASLAIKSFGA